MDRQYLKLIAVLPFGQKVTADFFTSEWMKGEGLADYRMPTYLWNAKKQGFVVDAEKVKGRIVSYTLTAVPASIIVPPSKSVAEDFAGDYQITEAGLKRMRSIKNATDFDGQPLKAAKKVKTAAPVKTKSAPKVRISTPLGAVAAAAAAM